MPKSFTGDYEDNSQNLIRHNIDVKTEAETYGTEKSEKKIVVCPVCGKSVKNEKFCSNCGACLKMKICPFCGAKNAMTVNFCNNCGNYLS